MIVSATAISGLAAEGTPSAKDLTYITNQFPLFNFQKDGRLQGTSVDLLELVWKRMGASLNRSTIEFLPWTEGYKRTLNEKNTVLFATARLPEREQLFKWAGPIGSDTKVLLAKKDKNLTIAGPEDLKNYRIGVIKDDSAMQLLLDDGAREEDLVVESTSKPIIEMLQNDSIDAWAYSDTAGRWLIQDSGANSSDYRAAYVLGKIDAYYAFNKETPDYLVQSFQQALDYIKSNKDEDGVSDYERINSQPQNQPPEANQEILWIFIQAGDTLSSNLTKIDAALANASFALSRTGLQGPKAQAILLNLSTVDPTQIDCITVGLNGSILEVEPDEYGYIKGNNIGYQEHIRELFAAKRPAGMAYIKSIEGFHAVDFAVPVFDENGCLMGATTILINATKFLDRVLTPYQPGNGSKIWVMQPDGLVLYETDASQIGLNAFEDPMFRQFPDLIALAERVRTDSSGHGTYEFYNDQHTQMVKKGLYWTTIYHQGEPIRLMLTV